MPQSAASFWTQTDAGADRAAVIPPLNEKRAFLASGAAWPDEPPPFCIETPSSLVFLTRHRAFKLKKPVVLPDADLRRLADRARICAEDFRLNRMFAPEVYRRLVPLVREGDGRLVLGGRGRVVDWLVEMVRLPAAQMLDRRLAVGPCPRRDEIADLGARLIASYHRQPWHWRAGVIYHARLTAILRADAACLVQQERHLAVFPLVDLLAWVALRLAMAAPEIRLRGVMGLLCDGHGDMRIGHVCLSDPPLAFHRVAASPDMRLIDPYHELTALGLDAAQLGAEWIGPALLDQLAQAGLRPPSRRLLGLYAVLQCLTQARAAIDPAHMAAGQTPAQGLSRMRCLLAMAARIGERTP